MRSRTTNSAFRANDILCKRNQTKLLFCKIKISESVKNEREIKLRARGTKPYFMQAMQAKGQVIEHQTVRLSSCNKKKPRTIAPQNEANLRMRKRRMTSKL